MKSISLDTFEAGREFVRMGVFGPEEFQEIFVKFIDLGGVVSFKAANFQAQGDKIVLGPAVQ